MEGRHHPEHAPAAAAVLLSKPDRLLLGVRCSFTTEMANTSRSCYKLQVETKDHILLENGEVNPMVFDVAEPGLSHWCELNYEACVAMGGGTIIEPRACHQRRAMAYP